MDKTILIIRNKREKTSSNPFIHRKQWGTGNDILKPSSFRWIKGIVYLTTAQIVGDSVKKQMHY